MNASRYGAGLCTVTLEQLPIRQVVAIAVQAGLRALEWAGRGHVPAGDLGAAQLARSASAAAGLDAASYGSYFHAGGDRQEDFDAVLATALALGAGNIRVWAGPRGVGPQEAGAGLFEAVAGSLRRAAADAAREGLTVSLEFHRQTLTEGTDAALRLLDAVAMANLFCYWQPLAGTRPEAAVQQLEALRPHLSNLHVFCWDPERRRYPLCDCRALWMAALRSAEPSPRWRRRAVALLEFVREDRSDAVLEDALWLRDVLRGGDACDVA